MNTMANFDTLKLAKKLAAAGFSQKQAEGAAEAFSESLLGTVVTEQYLDVRLAESRSALEVKIAESKTEVLRWMFLAMIGQTAVLAAVVKLL